MLEIRRGLCAVLALSLWAVPARANWQFTQWGMSPDQVMVASKGMATRAKPTTPDAYLRRLVTMMLASGNLDFNVDFLFSPKQKDALLAVRLVQYWGAASELFLALKEKYGAPYVGVDEKAGIFVERYWTRNGDDITFTWLVGGQHAILTYQPHDPSRLPRDRANGANL